MKNDVLKFLGIAAIVFAAVLNLRNANDDYGIKNNSLWSVVGAQTTTTSEGGNSTTGGNFFCIMNDCIGYKNCQYFFVHFKNIDGQFYTNDGLIGGVVYGDIIDVNYIPKDLLICQQFIGRSYQCSENQPGNASWTTVTLCMFCSPMCTELPGTFTN